MTYLYGDSTPSPIRSNFIDLLRRALEVSVELLGAEQQLVTVAERRREVQWRSDADVASLRRLEQAALRTLRELMPSDLDTPATRCAKTILAGVGSAVEGEVQTSLRELADEQARIDGTEQRELEACRAALFRLFGSYDLPSTSSELVIDARGAAASARLLGKALGLTTTVELEIPATHLFARAPRLERILHGLELQGEKRSGLLRRERRLTLELLDRYYLTELRLANDQAVVRLRGAPDGSGAGYNLEIAASRRTARTETIAPNGCAADRHDLAGPDAEGLLALHAQLLHCTADLLGQRRSLNEVSLDGQPLGAPVMPHQIVRRLVAALTPTVKEIALRSKSPGELILKRVLADDRREEVFVTRAELAALLQPLPAAARAWFAPLELDAAPVRAAGRANTEDGNDLVEIVADAPSRAPSEGRKRAESPVIVVVGE